MHFNIGTMYIVKKKIYIYRFEVAIIDACIA